MLVAGEYAVDQSFGCTDVASRPCGLRSSTGEGRHVRPGLDRAGVEAPCIDRRSGQRFVGLSAERLGDARVAETLAGELDCHRAERLAGCFDGIDQLALHRPQLVVRRALQDR